MDEPLEFFKAVFVEGNRDTFDMKGLRKTVPIEKVYEVGHTKPILVMDKDTGEKSSKIMEITSVCLMKVLGVATIVISARPQGTDLPAYPLWYRPDLQNVRLHSDADALYGFTILDFGDL